MNEEHADPAAPRVLVVDDEPAIRLAVQEAPLGDGYAAAVAANGRTALAVVELFRPDVILLDLRMPVMDGHAFLTEYRLLPEPRPPVVICSTQALMPGDLAGVAGYVSKPFDIDLLIVLLHRHAVAFAARRNGGTSSGA